MNIKLRFRAGAPPRSCCTELDGARMAHFGSRISPPPESRNELPEGLTCELWQALLTHVDAGVLELLGTARAEAAQKTRKRFK